MSRIILLSVFCVGLAVSTGCQSLGKSWAPRKTSVTAPANDGRSESMTADPERHTMPAAYTEAAAEMETEQTGFIQPGGNQPLGQPISQFSTWRSPSESSASSCSSGC